MTQLIHKADHKLAPVCGEKEIVGHSVASSYRDVNCDDCLTRKCQYCDLTGTICKTCNIAICYDHGKEHIENWELYHAPVEDE